MRKLTLTLALVLCLVLCAFAFASCGGSKTKSTTAQETTPSTTVVVGCDHVWNTEYTVDVNPSCIREGAKSIYCTKCGAMKPDSTVTVDKVAHTPAADYTVDTEPNCSDKGYKSKHCTVCGSIIADTVVEIDPIADAHVVLEWDTVNEPTLLSPSGSRTGTCSVCHNPVTEETEYKPTVEVCTVESAGQYFATCVTFEEILSGGKHFYPTDDNPDGNDLFIESSILWNATMLNIDGNKGGAYGPYCATRIAAKEGGDISNMTYWSGTDSPKGSWCPYAGGFEGATLTGGSPAGMMKENGDYSDYPNIGGTDENNPEYGWHRIGVRVHQEVTNLSDLKADMNTEAEYKITVTVYFDGVEMYEVYGDFQRTANRLYSVESNGDGTVTYTDIDGERCVYPFIINSTMAKSDTTAYIVLGDEYATCGKDFVQNVTKVSSPTAATLTVDEENNVTLSAPFYYKLK